MIRPSNTQQQIMISLEVNTSSLSHIEVTFFDILDDIVTAEEKRVG